MERVEICNNFIETCQLTVNCQSLSEKDKGYDDTSNDKSIYYLYAVSSDTRLAF